MRFIITFAFLVVLSSWWVNAQPSQPLAQCSTTVCTSTSDCPKTNSFDEIVNCVNGTCISTKISYLGIGSLCDSSSRCMEGLYCANFGLEDDVTMCQTTRSFGCSCTEAEQCDGFLCINGICDALRSIGDPCTTDEHCGSVCTNGKCAAGAIGAKCNSHRSCDSNYCDDENTCQNDPRPPCSESASFNGRCDDPNAICYDGVCYRRNGEAGSACNTTLPGIFCKLSLACKEGICTTVPEGSPCSSALDCNKYQSCTCASNSGGSTSQYGCYTTQGLECAFAYQQLEDCLNKCSERDAEGIPNTCANKCVSLRSAYDCCNGCETDMSLINYNGTCPDIYPVDCCSSTKSCSVASCGTGQTTPQPSTTPEPSTTSVPPGSTTNSDVDDDNRISDNSSVASTDLPYLFFAGCLVVWSILWI